MESISKNKLNKEEEVEFDNFYVKRKNTFNYLKNEKIVLKKRPNSMFNANKKKNNLSIKYDFNVKKINSIILKTFKKQKTSFIFPENNYYCFIKNNFVRQSHSEFSRKKKIIDDQKIKNELGGNNIINETNNNDNLKRRVKKFNSLNCCKSLIPLITKNDYKKEDFEVLALIGKGAYGTVLQVKLKPGIGQESLNNSKNKDKDKSKLNEKFFAIKVMDIDSMKSVNKLYQIYLESQILYEMNSPYIVKIHGVFFSKGKIYIVLDYLSKGSFAAFLKMNYPLKEDTIRFYAAEIILFLEYLQSQKIVHRDLKPENIMLNDKFHLQMIDFATARKIGYYYDKKEMKFKEDNFDLENDDDDIKGAKVIVNPDDDDDEDEEEEEEEEDNNSNENNINYKRKIKKIPPRNKTFVGTAEYVSPEVIGDQPAGYGADLWAFGIMLYQMFCGKTPFKGGTNYITFKNIEKLKISYPENVTISENAKDLINKILIKDPSKRLGAGEPKTELDLEHLKKHPFFKGIKWKNIINQNVPNSKSFKFICNKKMVKRNKDNKNIDKMKNSEDKNVKVVKQGLLNKKSFWFHYNERYLILDTTPKITYKDPEKNIVKGVIYLNKKCRVYASRQDIFNLDITSRVYKFKCKPNELILWIDAIKECIKNYGKEE